MKSFLRKIGLLEEITLVMEIDQGNFLKNLQNHVEEKKLLKYLTIPSSKNEYEGIVGDDFFIIKRKRQFPKISTHHSLVKGKFTTSEKGLIINIEIDPIHRHYMLFFIMGIIAFPILIVSALTGNFKINEGGLFAIYLTIQLFALVVIMKRSVTRTKFEIEHDLYSMIKQQYKNPIT